VILINLLPHREAKRLQRKRAFFVGVAAFALAGASAKEAYDMADTMVTESRKRYD
jgi:hypothetical protein